MSTEKPKRSDSVIDENLKRVFEETLDAGIPDRFKILLDQLKDQESNQDSKQ